MDTHSVTVTVKVEVDLVTRRPVGVHEQRWLWVTAETWEQAEQDAMNMAACNTDVEMVVGCRIVDWQD